VTNRKEIKPGESLTLTGVFDETTAKPHLPQYMDRVIAKNAFLNVEKWAELDQSFFYPHYDKCSD